MATLTWQAEGRSVVFTVQGTELSIGRDAGNTIRVDSPYVSKRHCVLRLTADGYAITDAGSANGTLVNGREIKTALLRDGDRVELGSEQLIFAGTAPAAAPSTPAARAAAPAAAGAAAGAPVKARNPWIFRSIAMLPVLLLLMLVVIGKMSGGADAPAPGTPGVVGSPAAPAAAQPAAPDVIAIPAPQTPAPAAASPAVPGDAAGSPVPPLANTAIVVPPGADSGALYDLALAHIKGGRLLEARRYLQESLARDPAFRPAQHRLREVEATVQIVVDQHSTSAQRAFSYLRYRDAILEWEQVVGMTDPADQRHQQALTGIAQAKARMAGR